MTAIAHACRERGFDVQPLNTSHAFHSRLIEPMLAEFTSICATARFEAPQRKIISNLTGRVVGQEMAAPDYWGQQARSPVRFAAGLMAADRMGVEAYLEIGPHPVLTALAAQGLAEEQRGWLPSLRRGEDAWTRMLRSLGELYTRGATVDWKGFDRDYSRSRVLAPHVSFRAGAVLPRRDCGPPTERGGFPSRERGFVGSHRRGQDAGRHLRDRLAA